MLLGYRMKKRCMPAYDKIIVPEFIEYRPRSEELTAQAPAGRRRLKGGLRAAACMVLAFLMIGLVVSRNNQGQVAFTLVAYAAAPTSGNPADGNSYALSTRSLDLSTGVTLKKNVITALPTFKSYVTKGADGNNYSSNIENYYDNITGTKSIILSSGFQFTGDTIESVTMTAEKGRFVVYDSSKTMPILQKYTRTYSKNGMMFAESSGQYSDADQKLLDSLIKRGTTVTFSPAGMTAYWDYTLGTSEKTADTLTITVKYLNGATQTSNVSIFEGENGVVTAELR